MALVTALLIAITNAMTGIKKRIANAIHVNDSADVTVLYST